MPSRRPPAFICAVDFQDPQFSSGAPAPPPPPRRYYRMDNRKLSFRECWNLTSNGNFLVFALAKLLHLRVRFAEGYPYFDSFREFKVPQENFPPDALAALAPLWRECHDLGFTWAQFYVYSNLNGDTASSMIALFHPSGATLRLIHTKATRVNPPKVKTNAFLLNQLADGTFLITSGQRQQFDPIPGVLVNRLVGAPVAQRIQSHLQKLEQLQAANPAVRVDSVEALDDLWDRYEKFSRDAGFQRGRNVFMTPAETDTAQAHVTAAQSMAGTSAENLPVLVELAKIQNQKASWTSGILLLVISLGLFIGAGSKQWSLNYVLILVPVLFIHELGHYLAMRIFHYRNLRMFFIPFFGAAVSGQHFNVPGWKKVVVSLMGPVPGIILGIVCGGAGLVLHQALLVKIAVVALLLNGFNLLPVLPLDGGWVVHTLLFSRHYIWDIAFRVIAALALIAIGLLSHSKYLAYVSIPMFLSLPVAYRTAKAAAALRARGISPASADSQTVPPETAQAIIQELRAANSNNKFLTNKLLAQQTLQVFETLNTRPPEVLPTIGLLFAQFAGLGVAIVFAIVFIVFQRHDVRDLINAAALGHPPKHTIVCDNLSFWHGAQATNIAANKNTLIATFAGGRDADQIFQSMTNRLPATASLTGFGGSLLLALPVEEDAARKNWLAELQRKTKDVFVDNTNFPASVSISFAVPDAHAADVITNELRGYFSAFPDRSLVPPWIPHDPRSSAERARNELARHTYILLIDSQYSDFNNPTQKALRKRMNAARRQGDQAELKKLTDEMERDNETLRLQNIERVRNGGHGPVDTNVADLFAELAKQKRDPDDERPDPMYDRFAREMGQFPLTDGHPAPGADRYSSGRAYLATKNLHVDVMYLTFNHVNDGAPAFIQWLCDHGCTDIKYEFHSGNSFPDAERD